MRARADAVAGAGRQGVNALVEAKRNAKDLFERIVKSGEVTLEDIGEAADAGRAMLDTLKATPGASCIVAKCPADLASNAWYARRGFALASTEAAKSGRSINVWRLGLA
jgi:hypothetical protein